jgi:hypothetical protein
MHSLKVGDNVPSYPSPPPPGPPAGPQLFGFVAQLRQPVVSSSLHHRGVLGLRLLQPLFGCQHCSGLDIWGARAPMFSWGGGVKYDACCMAQNCDVHYSWVQP